MRGGLVVLFIVMLLGGCQVRTVVVRTNDRDTGGGGIHAAQSASTVREGQAAGTGSSASSRGQGAVAGSGAAGVPGNAQSPSESNGGRALPH